MEGKEIARLIDEEWKHGVTMIMSEGWEGEVLCLFDHDYEYHLLIREWHKPHNTGAMYGLWFVGLEGTCSVKCWLVDSSIPPFVEAATIVEDWRRLRCSE